MYTVELMALEGNKREEYYGTFNSILNNEEFKFIRRSKRPSKDKIYLQHYSKT